MNTKQEAVTDSLVASSRETFKATYRQSLREAVDKYPDNYAWPDKSDANVERVAQLMFAAIERNSFNHDSKAFKIAARKLGIKSTRKEILACWNA